MKLKLDIVVGTFKINNINNKKINDHYNDVSNILRGSKAGSMNPGYCPNSNILKKEDMLYGNSFSLYIQALHNIDTNDKTILDISCGLGDSLYVYKKYFNFKEIYGIDNCINFIRYCSDKYKDTKVINMDGNNITFDDNSFDIITITDSIYFCNDYDLFFKNIKRILKDNGTFIINERKLDNNNFKFLSKHFNNIQEVDITDGIVSSCKFEIENINSFNFSNSQKEYILYSYGENLQTYKNEKFIKYICNNVRVE